MNSKKLSSRIEILDVIRGFAIVSIMLLHNIEHFDMYHMPTTLPDWMVTLDKIIWDTMFFLFGGKSYAIFALMFGVTFAIQLRNQEKKGKPFRARFAWRLLLLFAFGLLNSVFYQGDILTIYAVIGLLLIPLSKLNEKVLFWLASFLMLLPNEWVNLFYAIQHPLEKISDPVSWTYFGRMKDYIPNDSFVATVIGNFTNGKTGAILWTWNNGRFFSILGLFIYGYILGKRNLFRWTETSEKFWKKILLISIVAFIPLYIILKNLDVLITSDIIRRSVKIIEKSWTNFAFMLILVSGLTILFQNTYLRKKLMYFSSFGRMSLSNYIIQSILGASIYYGWGLGIYKYTGATYGILIGFVLTIFMGFFCDYWIKKFKQGPFEKLWSKLTWLGENKKS